MQLTTTTIIWLPCLSWRRPTGAKVISSNADSRIIEKGQPGYFGDWDAVAPVHVDRKVNDGDTIRLGSPRVQGHAYPGPHEGRHLPLPSRLDGKPGVVFTGDTLFRGATGRVDFEGGNANEMRASLKKLGKLPDSTIVFPGHEALRPLASNAIVLSRRFKALTFFT